jgi:signal transduction histidine kinase
MQAVVNEPVPMDRGILAQVLRENRSVRLEDARAYRPQMPSTKEYKESVGFDSILVCPLRVEEKVIGTLGVSRNPGGEAYSRADEIFLQELADRAALVVHNARLFEAAEAARRQAEKASLLKDEFLAAASHELRTPVTTVQLTLQTTLRQIHRLDEGQLSSAWLLPRLEKAESQTRRLVGLIDDLLEVSHIGSGRIGIHIEPMDLCELVRAVASRFEDHAAEAGSPVTVVAPPSVEGRWDRGRLDQVLTNLVANAIKYGRGQPITIAVSATERLARIAVIDRGIGVAPEHQARIFERFERAQSVRNYGGFGIGLWIVREIVTALGGSVRVESQPGEGATFVVELPR